VNGGNAGAYTKTGDHLRRPLECLRIGPCLQCRNAFLISRDLRACIVVFWPGRGRPRIGSRKLRKCRSRRGESERQFFNV